MCLCVVTLKVELELKTLDSCCTNDHTKEENGDENADKANVLISGADDIN